MVSAENAGKQQLGIERPPGRARGRVAGDADHHDVMDGPRRHGMGIVEHVAHIGMPRQRPAEPACSAQRSAAQFLRFSLRRIASHPKRRTSGGGGGGGGNKESKDDVVDWTERHYVLVEKEQFRDKGKARRTVRVAMEKDRSGGHMRTLWRATPETCALTLAREARHAKTPHPRAVLHRHL